MKRFVTILSAVIAVCCLFSACGFWMDGEYVSVTPHEESGLRGEKQVVEAASSEQMRTALAGFVNSGTTGGIITVAQLNDSTIRYNMEEAVRYVMEQTPIGAYAVEDIRFEIGTNAGVKAIAVEISYHQGRTAVSDIKRAEQMADASDSIFNALRACASGITVCVDRYEQIDLVDLVTDYAMKNPDVIMEQPQIAVSVYPESGESRVIDMTFTYQTSKESLRHMQDLVAPVFTSAELYVQGAGQVREKYAQIYAFLVERFDYTIETSNTPAYSLLLNGVGDCEAFARVYASMCRRADLECYVVEGTRAGEPWVWNIISFRGSYYHVDLLAETEFTPRHKSEMVGYVWEDAAYPD